MLINRAEIDTLAKAVREEGQLMQRDHGIGAGFAEYVATMLETLYARLEEAEQMPVGHWRWVANPNPDDEA